MTLQPWTYLQFVQAALTQVYQARKDRHLRMAGKLITAGYFMQDKEPYLPGLTVLPCSKKRVTAVTSGLHLGVEYFLLKFI